MRSAASKLKSMGVNMISIGVGSSISTAELHAMASSPTASHVFQVSSASLLSTIVNKVRVESCKSMYFRLNFPNSSHVGLILYQYQQDSLGTLNNNVKHI